LAQLQADNQTVSVRVTGLNKGGVLVDVKGLRGFIPRSHLTERDAPADLVGQTVTAGFLEVNPDANKLVLSQRLIAQATSMEAYAVGQLVEGQITALKPFGVFLKVGEVSALLHIKQISQNYIASLPDLFQIGQTLKAAVLELDEMKGRMSLSTRVLEKYPGEMIEARDTVMAEAEDRIRKLKGKI
jgi:small subunit ribosomal protein S1